MQLDEERQLQQKMRSNMQKLKEKIIDTGKLVELYTSCQRGINIFQTIVNREMQRELEKSKQENERLKEEFEAARKGAEGEIEVVKGKLSALQAFNMQLQSELNQCSSLKSQTDRLRKEVERLQKEVSLRDSNINVLVDKLKTQQLESIKMTKIDRTFVEPENQKEKELKMERDLKEKLEREYKEKMRILMKDLQDMKIENQRLSAQTEDVGNLRKLEKAQQALQNLVTEQQVRIEELKEQLLEARKSIEHAVIEPSQKINREKKHLDSEMYESIIEETDAMKENSVFEENIQIKENSPIKKNSRIKGNDLKEEKNSKVKSLKKKVEQSDTVKKKVEHSETVKKVKRKKSAPCNFTTLNDSSYLKGLFAELSALETCVLLDNIDILRFKSLVSADYSSCCKLIIDELCDSSQTCHLFSSSDFCTFTEWQISLFERNILSLCYLVNLDYEEGEEPISDMLIHQLTMIFYENMSVKSLSSFCILRLSCLIFGYYSFIKSNDQALHCLFYDVMKDSKVLSLILPVLCSFISYSSRFFNDSLYSRALIVALRSQLSIDKENGDNEFYTECETVLNRCFTDYYDEASLQECILEIVSNLQTKEKFFQMSDSISPFSLDDEVFCLLKALELLGIVIGWNWIYENIIGALVWPSLRSPNPSSISIILCGSLLSILSEEDRAADGSFSILSKRIKKLCNHKSKSSYLIADYEIQLSSWIAVILARLDYRKQAPGEIKAYFNI